MKILITGCKGQLGTELQKQLRLGKSELGPIPEKLRSATVIPVDLPELDISDYRAVVEFVRRHHPDVIINCAAYTNVDGCETHHDEAFKANAIGPRNLAQAAEKVGARLVHISTDYVFSGRENGGVPHDEAALPGPISAYGSTKLLGEQYAAQFCHRHFIVRTAWLYSYYGKNIVKTVVNAGRKYGRLEFVNDQLGIPTNAAPAPSRGTRRTSCCSCASPTNTACTTARARACAAGTTLSVRSSAWPAWMRWSPPAPRHSTRPSTPKALIARPGARWITACCAAPSATICATGNRRWRRFLSTGTATTA